MHATIGVVFNDLRVAPAVETSSFAVRVTEIPNQAGALAREALYTGIHRTFVIAHSHYANIDLPGSSEGFALGYTEAELDEIEEEVVALARDLAEKLKEEIRPKMN